MGARKNLDPKYHPARSLGVGGWEQCVVSIRSVLSRKCGGRAGGGREAWASRSGFAGIRSILWLGEAKTSGEIHPH